MAFLTRYLVMLHIVVLAIYLAWVHGGTRVEYLHGVPWLSLAMLEMLLLWPPVRKGEVLVDAQRRVLRGLRRDPLLYVGLALCGFLTLQWANSGTTAKLPWAPSSVFSDESRQQLYWFPPVWAALLAVRHGVLRSGQRLLLRILVWNGALLAVFGFIQNWSGTKELYWITPLESYFFATFGYPNLAGAFFTLMFAVSAGLWFHASTDPDKRRGADWQAVPVALNFAGAMGSLSRAAMLLTLLLLVVGGTYYLRMTWRQMELAGRIKIFILGTCSGMVAFALLIAYPHSNLRTELARINPVTFYDDTIGERLFQYRSAWDMTKDHPFFGVGGWGYRQFAHKYVTPEEYKVMLSGKGMANVHNDMLQFLCEHGVVGFGLMLAAVGLLLAPFYRGVRLAVQVSVDNEWSSAPQRSFLLRIPPMAWCVLAGTTATVVHSLIDLPFRSPAIMIVWSLCLACVPAFLPRKSVRPAVRTAQPDPEP